MARPIPYNPEAVLNPRYFGAYRRNYRYNPSAAGFASDLFKLYQVGRGLKRVYDYVVYPDRLEPARKKQKRMPYRYGGSRRNYAKKRGMRRGFKPKKWRGHRMWKRRSGPKRRFKNFATRHGGLLFPRLFKAKMHYQTQPQLDFSGGTTANFYFKSNTMDSAGTFEQGSVAHQPRGHDEMATFFDYYTIVGAKFDVIFEFDNVDIDVEQDSVICYIQNKTNSTAPTFTRNGLVEGAVPNVKYRELSYVRGNRIRMTKYCQVSRIIDKKNLIEENKTSINGTPTYPSYTHVGVIADSATSVKVNTKIHVTLYVVYTGPKLVAQS